MYAARSGPVTGQSFEFSPLLAAPYFIVLVIAILGVNVFMVLGIGILLFFGIGLATGSLTVSTAFSAMGSGTAGMFETMIVTVLVASISALMRAYGGFAAILASIRRTFGSRRGGMLGIGILTGLMDIATANNTVAIVVAAPIAKEISREYDIDPKRTASLLDTVSCIFQGVIPYGAQLLIAASLSGLSSVAIIPFLFYPFLLFVCVMVSILLEKS